MDPIDRHLGFSIKFSPHLLTLASPLPSSPKSAGDKDKEKVNDNDNDNDNDMDNSTTKQTNGQT